jgi:hypothetical protein
MATATLEKAYPGIAFRWRSRNWWARLTRVPPECVHLEHNFSWMATYAPDTLYLQGKASPQRHPARPEVSLCRDCLLAQLEGELARYPGHVVAFEPDGHVFSQYFFVDSHNFAAAGLKPEVAAAIAARLQQPTGHCRDCNDDARWLWIQRTHLESLDDVNRIVTAQALELCPTHGARQLCESLASVSEVNLMYVNAPYGDDGAYLWI